MADPLLTVGMPVYNGAPFVEEALGCLLSQTFREFKVLISDDASTDATPSLLKNWQARDSRLKVVWQPKNLGMLGNFRFVCEQADTPWFLFAAQDDLWGVDFLKQMVATASARSNCPLVVPRVIMRDLRRARERVIEVPPGLNQAQGDNRVRLLLRHAAGTWIYGLFQRSVLVNIFGQLEGYAYAWGLDPLLLLPVLLQGQVWGNDRAIFYAIDRGNRDSFKPSKYAEQSALYRSYIARAWRLWKGAPLDTRQRLRLLPHFVLYMHRHGCKVRRLLLSALAAALKSGWK